MSVSHEKAERRFSTTEGKAMVSEAEGCWKTHSGRSEVALLPQAAAGGRAEEDAG